MCAKCTAQSQVKGLPEEKKKKKKKREKMWRRKGQA